MYSYNYKLEQMHIPIYNSCQKSEEIDRDFATAAINF